jgi:MOSC domain-containing protein YiiM
MLVYPFIVLIVAPASTSGSSGIAPGVVESVHRSDAHLFSKQSVPWLSLIAGVGADGDAHAGSTVQHRSRVAKDPGQPNLRQLHLIGAELHDELRAQGFDVGPGDLGENVTTRGLDLLGLPVGTVLRIGEEALVAVTGLRNPCRQIDAFREGLLAAVAYRGDEGALVRKAGIMGVVVLGGDVRPGDPIEAQPPPGPHRTLQRV